MDGHKEIIIGLGLVFVEERFCLHGSSISLALFKIVSFCDLPLTRLIVL